MIDAPAAFHLSTVYNFTNRLNSHAENMADLRTCETRCAILGAFASGATGLSRLDHRRSAATAREVRRGIK